MSSAFSPDGIDADLAFDVFAAQLRLQHHDALEQAELIAQRLCQLLPHLSQRSDQNHWPFGAPTLKRLRIALLPEQYELAVERGHVHYRAVHHVSGIDLGHRELSQEDWIQHVMKAIAAQPLRSDSGRNPLL